MDGKIAKYGASPEVDKWHKVRINAAGDGHVYFYLDGQLRWKVKDDKYNHGVARFGNGCRNFEMKNLMVKETSVAHSQKWVLGLAKGSYGSKDIGKDEFNKIFQQSSSAIIKRVCSSCSNDYKEIYYRRYTNPSSFTPYDYMKQNWFSKNNAVNKDFGIFSSYADALSKSNPWKYCNYNDPGIGFPRDCGKTGGVGGQWNSWTRGGKVVAYYIDQTPAACSVPSNLGTFGDVRSGNQQHTGGKTMGTLPASSAIRTVAFKYKYVVGYCSKKGQGTGPVLSIKVSGQEVWSRQLKLASDDYPYDKNCGGNPKNYSPVQTSLMTIPAGVAGTVHLSMVAKDRNIHVVGLGMSCKFNSKAIVTSFAASLGEKNGVPARKYKFDIVRASTSSGRYSDVMIKDCKAIGMKPVCDHPSYCKNDKKSLYIGNTHHIAYPGHRNNGGYAVCSSTREGHVLLQALMCVLQIYADNDVMLFRQVLPERLERCC